MLISIAIIGLLTVLLISIIRNVKPDENEAMHKKATFIVERVVNELSSDEFLYPQKGEFSGFSNNEAVTVNGQSHSGATKFCTLFASRINKKPDTVVNCVRDKVSATSIEGIDWYLPISDFQNGAETLMVDVNGAAEPNTIGIDRFEYKINPGVKIPVVEVPRMEATAPPPPRPEIGAPPDVNDTKNGLESYSINCNGEGATVFGTGGKKVNGNYTLVAIPKKGYKCSWFTKQVTVKDADVADCGLTCTPDTLRPTLDGEPSYPPDDGDDDDDGKPDEEKTYCINVTMTGEADKCTVSGAGCNKSNGQYIVKISSSDSSKYIASWTEKSVIVKDSDVNLTAECAGKKYVSWEKTSDSPAESCPESTVFQNKIIYDKCAGCADAKVQLLDPGPKVEAQNMNANGVRGLFTTIIREDTAKKIYRYKLLPPANAEVLGSDIYTITYGSCSANEKCYNINVTGDIVNCPVKLPEGSCKTDKNKYSNGKYDLVITPKSGYWYNGAENPYTASVFVVDSDVNYNVVCQKAPAKKYILTVNYVNKNGEQINTPQKLQYSAGNTYKIEYPQIKGYKAPDGALTGTMPDKDLTLTVVYEAEAVQNATARIWFTVQNVAYNNSKGTVTLTPANGGNPITVSLDGLAPGSTSYKDVVVPAGTYNVTTSSGIQIFLSKSNKWVSVKNITTRPTSITIKPGGTGDISVKAEYRVRKLEIYVSSFNSSFGCFPKYSVVNMVCTMSLYGEDGTISTTIGPLKVQDNNASYGGGIGGTSLYDLYHGTYTLSGLSCKYDTGQAAFISGMFFGNSNGIDPKQVNIGSALYMDENKTLEFTVSVDDCSNNEYALNINYVDEDGVSMIRRFDSLASTAGYIYPAGYKYTITAPPAAGYTPDKPVITGTMPYRNIEITFVYRKN